MKNVIVLIFAAALFVMSSCTTQVDIAAEQAKVDTVLDQVIQMTETGDMELFDKVFAHDPEMVCFGTDADERVVGWEALKSVMQEQFAATEKSELSVRDRVIRVHDSGEIAWFSEIIDWDMVVEGQALHFEGLRGTGVMQKQDGNWAVIQLHYSLPAQ